MYENVFSKDLLDTLKELPLVLEAKEKLAAQPVVYFNIPLTQELRSALESRFGLDLSSVSEIPMRWLKGDTVPHIDTGREAFQTTHLVYLSDSEGELVIGDSTLPITQNTGYTFQQGTLHGTRNTGTAPRLLLGPMSETAQAVGGPVTFYFLSESNALDNENVVASYGGYMIVAVSGITKWRIALTSTGSSPQGLVYDVGDVLEGAPPDVYYLYPASANRQQVRNGTGFQVFNDIAAGALITFESATLHLRPYPYIPTQVDTPDGSYLKGMAMYYTLTIVYSGTFDASGSSVYTNTFYLEDAAEGWQDFVTISFNLDGGTNVVTITQFDASSPSGSYIENLNLQDISIDSVGLFFDESQYITFPGTYNFMDTWYFPLPAAGTSGGYLLSSGLAGLIIAGPQIVDRSSEDSIDQSVAVVSGQAFISNENVSNLESGSTLFEYTLNTNVRQISVDNSTYPIQTTISNFRRFIESPVETGTDTWEVSEFKIIIDDGQ